MNKLPIIKRVLLSLVLSIESYLVGNVLKDFIQNQNYFSFSLNFTLKIVVLLVLTLYTLSFSIGTSDKWEYGTVFGIGVFLGVFFNLITYDTFYALLIALGSFLIINLNSLRSLKYKNNLIKAIPKLSLRFSTKGMLLIFGVLASTIFLLESSGVTNQINVGKTIAEITEKPVLNIVEKQISQIQLPLKTQELNENDPKVKTVLESLGLPSFLPQNLLSPENINISGIIESAVNRFLEPYKKLFSPVMAILIFAIFQFYATIAYYVYFLTINPLFSLLKKIGLIKTEKIQIEKEKLIL